MNNPVAWMLVWEIYNLKQQPQFTGNLSVNHEGESSGGKTNKEGDAEQGEQQEDQPPNPVPRREVRVGRPPQVPQTPFLD